MPRTGEALDKSKNPENMPRTGEALGKSLLYHAASYIYIYILYDYPIIILFWSDMERFVAIWSDLERFVAICRDLKFHRGI